MQDQPICALNHHANYSIHFVTLRANSLACVYVVLSPLYRIGLDVSGMIKICHQDLLNIWLVFVFLTIMIIIPELLLVMINLNVKLQVYASMTPIVNIVNVGSSMTESLANVTVCDTSATSFEFNTEYLVDTSLIGLFTDLV